MPTRASARVPPENMIAAVAVFVALLATGYAVAVHRPLFGDSNRYIFRVLNHGQLLVGGPYRYLTSLFEIPSLVLRTLGAPTGFLIRVYELLISFHPAVSLLVSYLILRRRGRQELFLFPFLSFAICLPCSQAFTAGQIHEVLSLFWPALLFFLTLPERPRAIEIIIQSALLLAMVASHEIAVLPYLLIGLLAIMRCRGSPSQRSQFTVVAALCGLGAAWCLFKPFFAQVTTRYEFFEAGSPLRDPFPWIGLLFSLGVATITGLRRDIRIERFLCPLAVVLLVSSIPGQHQLTAFDARSARVLTVPMAALLGLACVFRANERASRRWASQRILVATATAFLLVATLRDLKMSLNWAHGRDFVAAQIRDRGGCIVVPRAEIKREVVDRGMREWSLPLFSILIQETREPRAIVYSEPPAGSPVLDLCGDLLRRRLIYLWNPFLFPVSDKYFSLSFLR